MPGPLDTSPIRTSTPVPLLLNPYQHYPLCVLNKAFCKYFQKNEDGHYNESVGFHGQFLLDEPDLHEMRGSLVALTSLLCSTALLGVFGQLLVLWVYWRRLRVGPAGYLIIAVATVDLLVCALVIPLRITREWGTKFHSEVGCKMIELIQHQTVMVSLSLLTAIALERYWCIARAPKKLFSDRGAKIYIAVSIFASTLLAFPWGVAVTSQFLPPEHRGYCVPTASVISFHAMRNYSLFHAMLLMGLALLATFCYSLTLSFIHTQSEEIRRYAKRSGDWMSKRDKPKYSESESSDSSADTDSSDIEMQTHSLQQLQQNDDATDVTTVALQEPRGNGHVLQRPESPQLGNGHVTQAPETTEPPGVEGESTVQEPDTQPIVQRPYTDAESSEVPVEAAAVSSDEDAEGYSRVHRERQRRPHRKFHRNPWHRLKTRTALTMFSITLIFVVCHIPSVLMTYRIVPMIPVLYYMYLVPHTLSWCVYMIMNKHFREQAGKVCGLS